MNLGRVSGEPLLPIHPIPSLGNVLLTYDFKFVFKVCGSGLCRKETASLGCDYRKLQINNRHLSGCLGTLGLPQRSIVWVSYKQRKLTSYSFGAGILEDLRLRCHHNQYLIRGKLIEDCVFIVFSCSRKKGLGVLLKGPLIPLMRTLFLWPNPSTKIFVLILHCIEG